MPVAAKQQHREGPPSAPPANCFVCFELAPPPPSFVPLHASLNSINQRETVQSKQARQLLGDKVGDKVGKWGLKENESKN